MKLSIVIVNYNVKYFISQCLDSIFRSDLDPEIYEIIIVDNASTDGSFPFLEDNYGEKVSFIKLNENLGFGSACNKGVEKSIGELILFLNPDTLVENNTLQKSIERIKDDSSIGALGVKILDGKGDFLLESKRSFPTIWNSFSKMSGLSSLFPKSRLFSAYNLTYLDENQIHKIDALCGAFMLIPRSVLEKTGGFDEQFFMYGEDIDLCFRIKELGYKIEYYPNTSIVHFKGESNKEKDWNYINQFYSAMEIYANKHYNSYFSFFLKVSIYLAAFFSYVAGKIKNLVPIALEFIILYASFVSILLLWAKIYYRDWSYYDSLPWSYFLIYPLFFSFGLIVSFHYSPKKSFRNTFLGIIIGSLFLISVYALLPEKWRFSRAVTLIFIISTVPTLMISQSMINFIKHNVFVPYYKKPKSIGVLGSEASFIQVEQFLMRSSVNYKIVGRVGVTVKDISNSVGHVDQLNDLINIYDITEIIICLDDLTMNKVFALLKKLGNKLQFKVYSKANIGIIGSNNPSQSGEVYTTDLSFNIATSSSVLIKRIFDLLATLVTLLLFPFILVKPIDRWPNLFSIFIGKMSWVGYNDYDERLDVLPGLKKGFIKVTENLKTTKDQELIHWQNLQYAKNYSVFVDIDFFLKYLFTRTSNDR